MHNDIKKQFGNKGNTFSLIDNHRAWTNEWHDGREL